MLETHEKCAIKALWLSVIRQAIEDHATGEAFQALNNVQNLFKKVESNLRGEIVIIGQRIKTADQAQKESLEMEVKALERKQKVLPWAGIPGQAEHK